MDLGDMREFKYTIRDKRGFHAQPAGFFVREAGTFPCAVRVVRDGKTADGKKIFVWHLNGTEDMPCGAYYNNDEKRLWPGAEGDCLPHARYADTLKKIGFDGDCCTIEIFRPAYYEMSQEENVKKSAEVTRAHVAKYAQF